MGVLLNDGTVEAITARPPHRIRRPIMLQTWSNLAALHWSFPPAVVQRLLPEGFTVDTHGGRAWVGLLPFQMERIRLPGLPPFGPLSTFPETNIRTYVVDPTGRRGVWFFSLDVTRLVPALVARLSYRLPYCWAEMTVERSPRNGLVEWEYRSRRRWPKGEARSHVVVRVGEAIPPSELTELDHFLTARWALGSTFAKSLLWAKVGHGAWAIHRAEATGWRESLFTAAGLPSPTAPPYVRWSPGVHVEIERPRRIAR